MVTALLAEKQQVQRLGLECALCAQEIAMRVAGLYQRRQERAPGEDEQEGEQSDLVGPGALKATTEDLGSYTE